MAQAERLNERLLRWLNLATNRRNFETECLVLAAVPRLALALLPSAEPVSDAAWYWQTALNLAHGQGYVANGAPTAYFPVGYPAALAAALTWGGGHPFAGQMLQAACSLAIVWLTGALGRRLFQDVRVGRLAMAAVALAPVQWLYCGVLLSEPLFTALLLAIATLLSARIGQPGLSWARLVAGGLLTGAACLVKPQAVFVPLLALLADAPLHPLNLNWRRTLGRLAVVIGLAACVVLPWTARNVRQFGHVIAVSTNGGGNLWIGNNPDANGRYVDTPAVMRTLQSGADEFERDRNAAHAAQIWLLQHPGQALALLPKKLLNFYVPDRLAADMILKGQPALQTGTPGRLWQGLTFLAWLIDLLCLLVVPLGVALWWRLGRTSVPRVGLLFVAGLHGLHLVFFGASRFHFPMVPWVLLYGAAVWLQYVEHTQLRTATGGAIRR